MHHEGNCKVKVHIRWMIRRDMTDVLQIESQAFEFPWTEEDFIRCLRHTKQQHSDWHTEPS